MLAPIGISTSRVSKVLDLAQSAVVFGIGDNRSIGMTRQFQVGPPAQRAGLGKQIRHAQVMKGRDHVVRPGAATKATRQQVNCRMQVVGRRLVLDVHNIGLDRTCHRANPFGQSPTPRVDFGVDVVDAGRNEMHRTGLPAGENVHVRPLMRLMPCRGHGYSRPRRLAWKGIRR